MISVQIQLFETGKLQLDSCATRVPISFLLLIAVCKTDLLTENILRLLNLTLTPFIGKQPVT